MKKTGGRKSRDTLPLKQRLMFCFLRCPEHCTVYTVQYTVQNGSGFHELWASHAYSIIFITISVYFGICQSDVHLEEGFMSFGHIMVFL